MPEQENGHETEEGKGRQPRDEDNAVERSSRTVHKPRDSSISEWEHQADDGRVEDDESSDISNSTVIPVTEIADEVKRSPWWDW